uniref:Uncharacterized protein n=1 Tax=Grammatophora oceanica TaxID=210454 RepID=A0A6U5P0J3_9STRA|mmetsp:Transcript_48669/g.72682  ORF Transcript_48669/g.72682 Transcript_48669/m.72682 type:complete len:137 (+) Transcript_48669:38-448(+)|eukprot:CAMPEP_0194027680 /NCGR_PEP_ID=MMETSP0009_2-20130614/1790_1 /TAXON_ID=210454 /ORGANISM="Grammatophora oceanica, Strain CCMP 410" /LENGTH=136 /DNA_ID=CAMNT_0038666829 /DNA_START=38 /DNA_END=448 /DNA_ORIENTATION=+
MATTSTTHPSNQQEQSPLLKAKNNLRELRRSRRAERRAFMERAMNESFCEDMEEFSSTKCYARLLVLENRKNRKENKFFSSESKKQENDDDDGSIRLTTRRHTRDFSRGSSSSLSAGSNDSSWGDDLSLSMSSLGL